MPKRLFVKPSRLEQFHSWFRFVEFPAGILALISITLHYGAAEAWGLSKTFFLALEAFASSLLLVRVPATFALSAERKQGLKLVALHILVLALALILTVWALTSPGTIHLRSVLHVTTLGLGALWGAAALRDLQRLSISPLMLFTVTYGAITALGAGVLMLPGTVNPGTDPLGPVEALFMSASATCVTGLSLYDVGAEFSLFGQLVLLVLFQIGGLGLMTFAAFAVILSGSGMSLKDRVALGEVLNLKTVGRVGRLVTWIIVITFVFEVLGMVMTYGEWVGRDGELLDPIGQLYYSAFHAVSAFCNAGFSLQANSLTSYYDNLWVMLPTSGLIVIGGLGFAVILDLVRFKPWRHRVARRLPIIGRRVRRTPLPHLSLQTKLVISMTLLLMLGGSVAFWLLESGNTLAGMSSRDQAVTSFFQGGITPRTAGFNSVNYREMGLSTQYVTMLLMLIGAGPGSTAGGLKVTAAAILLLAIWNTLRSRPVEVFHRRISEDQIYRVLVLLVVGLITLSAGVFALTMTEAEAVQTGRIRFHELLFESVSAFGTVGLSAGATSEISPAGHVILSVFMFLGRIGPLTLILGIGRRARGNFQYPEESVMLG